MPAEPVNPGGKPPTSFPRAVGQLPVHYNHESTGRPYDPDNKFTSKYLDLPGGPRYAFGYKLSYTAFALGAPRLSTGRIAAAELRAGGTVEVAVSVATPGSAPATRWSGSTCTTWRRASSSRCASCAAFAGGRWSPARPPPSAFG